MKFNLTPILVIFSIIIFSSCQEDNTVEPKQEEEIAQGPSQDPPADDSNVVVQGTFSGASGHTTTGTAQVKQIDVSTKSLVLTGFKTDNGPDLKYYIAEDKNAKNFLELDAKVENGTMSMTIPNDIDLDKKKFVLIWYKAFSVSFGFAELKKPE